MKIVNWLQSGQRERFLPSCYRISRQPTSQLNLLYYKSFDNYWTSFVGERLSTYTDDDLLFPWDSGNSTQSLDHRMKSVGKGESVSSVPTVIELCEFLCATWRSSLNWWLIICSNLITLTLTVTAYSSLRDLLTFPLYILLKLNVRNWSKIANQRKKSKRRTRRKTNHVFAELFLLFFFPSFLGVLMMPRICAASHFFMHFSLVPSSSSQRRFSNYLKFKGFHFTILWKTYFCHCS